jgi:hypothetical protein
MNHELRYCAARSRNTIEIRFIHQGLHEFPNRLNQSVLDALQDVEQGSCDYVLVNYGLCGNGTLDIFHEQLPIVIHNVQDCIPLILGDSKRHRAYVEDRPGTFWFSVGWIEGFPLPGSPDYEEHYSEFYGATIDEDRRDILERVMMENYTHLTYIEWECLGEKINRHGTEYTQKCVEDLNRRLGFNLQYDRVVGDPLRLQRFVDGDWNGDEFVILKSGQRLRVDPLQCRLYGRFG